MWSRCVPLCVPLAFPIKNLRIVLSQLNEHLNLNNLLSPLESAYRPSYSNETALLGTFVFKDLLTAQQDLHSNTVRSISCVWYFRLDITFSWLDCTTCLVFLVQHFSLFCPISLQQNTGRHHKWATIAANLSLSLSFAPLRAHFWGLGISYFTPTQPLFDSVRKHTASYHVFSDDTPLCKIHQAIENIQKIFTRLGLTQTSLLRQQNWSHDL